MAIALRALRLRGLKEAMLLLIANDASLGAEWLDHALKGDWADHKECHISGNFLLLYQVEANWINFVRPAPIPSCSAVDRLLMACNWH